MTTAVVLTQGWGAGVAACAQPVAEEVNVPLTRSATAVDFTTPAKHQATGSFTVDEPGRVMVVVRAAAPIASVRILTPTGAEINANTIAAWHGSFAIFDPIPDNSAPDAFTLWPGARIPRFVTWNISFVATERGVYTTHAAAPEGQSGDSFAVFEVSLDEGVGAVLLMGADRVRVNNDASGFLILSQNGLPVAGASAEVRARPPTGTPVLIVALDDGQSPDTVANDGVYAFTYTPTLVGVHGISVHATGVNRNGHAFVRHTGAAVNAVSPCGSFSAGPSWAVEDADQDTYGDGVIFSFPVTAQEAGRYTVTATVRTPWGEDAVIGSAKTLAAGAQVAFKLVLPVTPERARQVDGRFTVTSAVLSYRSPSGESRDCDERFGLVLQTDVLNSTTFNNRRWGWTFNDNWVMEDVDADGKADYLKVRLGIEAARATRVYFGGGLYNNCGKLVQWAHGTRLLAPGIDTQQIELVFSGCVIGYDGIGVGMVRGVNVHFDPEIEPAVYNLAFGKDRDYGPVGALAFLFECSYRTPRDCNNNGVPDVCELMDGVLHDRNGNGIADEVEPGFACPPGSALCFADITGVGGPPSCPDGQLTVDDIIAFINATSDPEACTDRDCGSCLIADVTGVGGPPSTPDGQVTVDDIIAFVNLFGAGCEGSGD